MAEGRRILLGDGSTSSSSGVGSPTPPSSKVGALAELTDDESWNEANLGCAEFVIILTQASLVVKSSGAKFETNWGRNDKLESGLYMSKFRTPLHAIRDDRASIFWSAFLHFRKGIIAMLGSNGSNNDLRRLTFCCDAAPKSKFIPYIVEIPICLEILFEMAMRSARSFLEPSNADALPGLS